MTNEQFEKQHPEERKFLNRLQTFLRQEVVMRSSYFKEENDFLSILWRGKFLRSRIIFYVYRDLKSYLGRRWQRIALNVSAGIEVIHLASLLHDDVIDRSLFRRGLPAFYCKFGEGSAIVWGDWLFAVGVEFFNRVSADFYAIDAIKNICRGQLIEEKLVRYEDISWNSYYEIIAYKTASLFIAGIEALKSFGIKKPVITKYADYIFIWGLCFQLYDDLLDLEEDFLAKKITFPMLLLKKWRFKGLKRWWETDSWQLRVPQKIKNKIKELTVSTVEKWLSLISCPSCLYDFDNWIKDNLRKIH